MSKKVTLEALCVQYWKSVALYVRLLGGSRDEAEDIAQQTFMEAIKSNIVEVAPEASASYLRTIARRIFMHSKRNNPRFDNETDLDAIEGAWNVILPNDVTPEVFLQLEDCLSKLGERERRALRLRYQESMRRERIGERLGLSGHGVAMLLKRSLSTLRACMSAKAHL